MSKLLTLEEGTLLTRVARQAIEFFIRDQKQLELPKTSSEVLQESRGVFVTLKKQHPRDKHEWMLRGCIGRLRSESKIRMESISLLEATMQAALSSALDDPRFPAVRVEELDSILVEVSVLTIPERLNLADRTRLKDQIVIGKDGLIIEGKGWHRGLLLPQVAPEQGWNAEEFLQGCCQKAGLPISGYLNPNVKVLKFQAQIFAETSPNGEIVERTF
jgi:uncharacterized protein (TIGR00296 family)